LKSWRRSLPTIAASNREMQGGGAPRTAGMGYAAGPPFVLSGTPVKSGSGSVGQHMVEMLLEFGYTPEELELRADGAFGERTARTRADIMNQIDLKDKVAVITGGTGGIGLASADRMLRSGATVVLWDKHQAILEQAQKELSGATGFQMDVTDEAAVERATADAMSRFGRIDILVNAAGITAPKTYIVDYPADLWRRILDINLTGTFLCCKAVARHMQKANAGRIVNIASVAGKEGNPFSSAYSASKAGVISFTKSLAKELAATEIRVNCIAPAIIATKNLYHDMPEEMQRLWVSRVPMGRPGRPEEVAAMIAWLASDECSFTTGAAFDLSGGRATY
jgi:NAD(P)-dependent dehydrogenase (short-subunit alcohol dehydrogenase family)